MLQFSEYQVFLTPDRINQEENCSNPEKSHVQGQGLSQNVGPDRLHSSTDSVTSWHCDPGQVEYSFCASVFSAVNEDHNTNCLLGFFYEH